MAAKDETIVQHLEHAVRKVHFAAARMSRMVDDLAEMEKHLPRDETLVSMFRLQIRGLKQEIKNMGQMEEK